MRTLINFDTVIIHKKDKLNPADYGSRYMLAAIQELSDFPILEDAFKNADNVIDLDFEFLARHFHSTGSFLPSTSRHTRKVIRSRTIWKDNFVTSKIYAIHQLMR